MWVGVSGRISALSFSARIFAFLSNIPSGNLTTRVALLLLYIAVDGCGLDIIYRYRYRLLNIKLLTDDKFLLCLVLTVLFKK
ncbi:hypothetical protein AOQ84DRAFT_101653 [Glonium stellatum]|uniref:Uncharacterized protein n=1 Tax=Glonium stellatum TaxID=574774 RepID=A0A8E2JPY9_9PEZI|nr:hypothetical protein AOQ84DRAFT_101653 [Glonium stellatum]